MASAHFESFVRWPLGVRLGVSFGKLLYTYRAKFLELLGFWLWVWGMEFREHRFFVGGLCFTTFMDCLCFLGLVPAVSSEFLAICWGCLSKSICWNNDFSLNTIGGWLFESNSSVVCYFFIVPCCDWLFIYFVILCFPCVACVCFVCI